MKVKAASMQAFPFIEPNADDAIKAYHPGMTMRDEFAKAAMQAILIGQYPITKDQNAEERIAAAAYLQADAMMEARK